MKKITVKFDVDILVKEDGIGYHAFCPALKGLHTSGVTKQEALENAKNAVVAYIRSLLKHNDPIPLKLEVIENQPEYDWFGAEKFSEQIAVYQ